MIEVLTHDLGKASQGRFGDHAEASAEMLRKAGFEEEAVLKELSKVGVLERNEERKYNLQKSLESKHSFKEANYRLPSDDKIKDAIMKMYSEGFEIEGITYQVGLLQLHVREMLNEGVSS